MRAPVRSEPEVVRLTVAHERRDVGADDVIVAGPLRDPGTWQERGVLEPLRRELDVPVVHLASQR
ncbi:hypothetical protein FSW04_12505 [Baekduia soli]|uniref:Uncharacterized protein n=1 Tax=Baekduia soli TaxID=496014 RepID=A0A5B8U5A8_9ACTN|nr:hypothetical protein [Baekduia soli]QEC48306.1 hypothetical protein FSW04_12505 [Baekduia soli]